MKSALSKMRGLYVVMTFVVLSYLFYGLSQILDEIILVTDFLEVKELVITCLTAYCFVTLGISFFLELKKSYSTGSALDEPLDAMVIKKSHRPFFIYKLNIISGLILFGAPIYIFITNLLATGAQGLIAIFVFLLFSFYGFLHTYFSLKAVTLKNTE